MVIITNGTLVCCSLFSSSHRLVIKTYTRFLSFRYSYNDKTLLLVSFPGANITFNTVSFLGDEAMKGT